ncbi:MAG: hypothetical protein PVF58_13590 [Candidatus Methanofastidiosia archaeon]
MCTYGGTGPGLTIQYLKDLIESKGGGLAGGFAVKMPYNYIIPSISFKKFCIIVTLKEVPAEEKKCF